MVNNRLDEIRAAVPDDVAGHLLPNLRILAQILQRDPQFDLVLHDSLSCSELNADLFSGRPTETEWVTAASRSRLTACICPTGALVPTKHQIIFFITLKPMHAIICDGRASASEPGMKSENEKIQSARGDMPLKPEEYFSQCQGLSPTARSRLERALFFARLIIIGASNDSGPAEKCAWF